MKPGMWSVFLLVPTGRAAMDEMPAAEDVEAVWKKLSRISHEVSFGVKTTEGHHYRRVALQEAVLREASLLAAPFPPGTARALCLFLIPGKYSPPVFSP